MNEKLKLWKAVARPPEWALKEIKGGRLKGKTDINPQWRYQVLTEEFGPCGTGWYYELAKTGIIDGSDGQKFVQVEIALFYKVGEEWSRPVVGVGGALLVVNESSKTYNDDDAIKKATTDALSVACKLLGVGADIYKGMYDGSKYDDVENTDPITPDQHTELNDLINETKTDSEAFLKYFKISDLADLPAKKYMQAKNLLEAKRDN